VVTEKSLQFEQRGVTRDISDEDMHLSSPTGFHLTRLSQIGAALFSHSVACQADTRGRL
jgi:hypothetical protein